jgi:hypothetical protein
MLSARTLREDTVCIIAQVIAVTLASLVVLYGLAAEYAVIFPRGAGEWTARLITAVYAVNMPIGTFSLLLCLLITKGKPGLRRLGLIASSIALVLPIVISGTDLLRNVLPF